MLEEKTQELMVNMLPSTRVQALVAGGWGARFGSY
jgi:hypothetical protein